MMRGQRIFEQRSRKVREQGPQIIEGRGGGNRKYTLPNMVAGLAGLATAGRWGGCRGIRERKRRENRGWRSSLCTGKA